MAEDDLKPALFTHCCDVYLAMDAKGQDKIEGRVYEGFLTKLVVEECGLSQPYYTQVTRKLKGMDCIRMLRRGGGSTPSLWLLIQPPSIDLFKHSPERPLRGAPNKNSRAPLDQKLRDANNRIASLERRVLDLERNCKDLLSCIEVLRDANRVQGVLNKTFAEMGNVSQGVGL